MKFLVLCCRSSSSFHNGVEAEEGTQDLIRLSCKLLRAPHTTTGHESKWPWPPHTTTGHCHLASVHLQLLQVDRSKVTETYTTCTSYTDDTNDGRNLHDVHVCTTTVPHDSHLFHTSTSSAPTTDLKSLLPALFFHPTTLRELLPALFFHPTKSLLPTLFFHPTTAAPAPAAAPRERARPQLFRPCTFSPV